LDLEVEWNEKELSIWYVVMLQRIFSMSLVTILSRQWCVVLKKRWMTTLLILLSNN